MTKARRRDIDGKCQITGTAENLENEKIPSGQNSIRGYHGKRGFELDIKVGEDLFH